MNNRKTAEDKARGYDDLPLDRIKRCNYNVIMKARIISIGNSRGIRIPKQLLELSNLGDEVELEAERDRIVIRSARQPRQGWDEAFRAMAAKDDDRLLDPSSPTKFDKEEWDW